MSGEHCQTHGRCDQKGMKFALILAVVELNLQKSTVRGSIHIVSQAIGDHEPSDCVPLGITAKDG